MNFLIHLFSLVFVGHVSALSNHAGPENGIPCSLQWNTGSITTLPRYFWSQDCILRQCWMRKVTHETPLLHGLINVLFYKHKAIMIALGRIALQKIHELLSSLDPLFT